jgi:hypothetical protein
MAKQALDGLNKLFEDERIQTKSEVRKQASVLARQLWVELQEPGEFIDRMIYQVCILLSPAWTVANDHSQQRTR